MLALRRQVGASLVARSALRNTSMRAMPLMFSQYRSLNTERVSDKEVYDNLVAQRKNRPLSPDLAIYKPQITAVLSGLHRITGVALGGVFYLWILAYGFGPLIGLNVSTAAIASAFGALPVAAKIAAKFLLSLPFTFHSWNGVRHLVWDTTKYLTNKGVIQTGYVCLGLTALSSLALAFL